MTCERVSFWGMSVGVVFLSALFAEWFDFSVGFYCFFVVFFLVFGVCLFRFFFGGGVSVFS